MSSAPSTSTPGSGDLADGQTVEVPGSGGRIYTLRNAGGVYSCSCPAWRNQSVPIEARTCKHLRRFRGDAAETERLGSLPERSTRTRTAADGPPLLLAMSYDATVHDPTGWWMSEKLDGVRALWDGSRFLSRLGKEFAAPEWFTAALPGVPLDGELFGGRGQFQHTVGVVRRIDRSEAWRALRFVVFDAPEHEGGFEQRLQGLQGLAGGWPEHLSALEHARCGSAEALEAEMDRIVGLGGEGLMLRKPGSAYVAGRSETLLKVKRFHEIEARVVAHVPGTGRHEGRLGALRVALENGTIFKVGTGFSDAEREAPPAVGVVVTVRYQELTKAGVPRFPSFLRVRSDVD
ncbi:MAG: DNA ligase [Myxococcales bacterium]|nr:DNA ligase [Myxococcales bacterium]